MPNIIFDLATNTKSAYDKFLFQTWHSSKMMDISLKCGMLQNCQIRTWEVLFYASWLQELSTTDIPLSKRLVLSKKVGVSKSVGIDRKKDITKVRVWDGQKFPTRPKCSYMRLSASPIWWAVFVRNLHASDCFWSPKSRDGWKSIVNISFIFS